VVAALVHLGGDVLVGRFTRHIPGAVDDVVLGRLHPAIWLSVLLLGASLGARQFDLSAGVADLVGAVTLSLVGIVWAVTAVRLGRDVSEAVTETRYVDRQFAPIFQNVWTALVAGVAVFGVLAVWQVDVTPLLASAGILGIIVGLAAKDTLANFFGSISLYADGTYRVGDYVVLESGERGRVEDISIRSTVIRTRDDVLVTVPNAVLSNASVTNESAPEPYRRVRVPVGVAYGSDPDEVEETLLAVAADEALIRESPSPRVRFRGFGDSALEVELLAWIAKPRLRGRAIHRLVRGTYDAFAEAGIEIPYPQRDVRMREGAAGGAGGDLGAPVSGGVEAADGEG